MTRGQDLSIDIIHNPLQKFSTCTERFSINHILKVNVTSNSKEIITLVLAYAVQPVDCRVVKLEKVTDFS
jgi:hypothetical protein